MKILILGGYGVFGGRLAQLLADAPVTLLIAGRSLAKARAFCADYPGMVPVEARREAIGAILAAHRPDMLVDATGPFQDYGADPYGVIRAAIAARVNYLDLADGADFVAGAGQFDAAARAAGVFVLTGVSSFPVLTSAVLTEMAKEMEIERVTGGIAPSPHAGFGMNVLRAVLGYAGKPVRMMRDGRPATGRGLAETLRRTVAPPGALPLHNTLFSLVDVPDLRMIPAAMPGIGTLWMGAGPLPEPLHRFLILLARLRLPGLARLAPLAHLVLNALRYGEHRGGMFIEAEGRRAGRPRHLSWHMLAEGDDGPFIPSMAVEAVIRHVLAGNPPAPGARSGVGALTLADYEALFARRAIVTGWRDDNEGPLYQQILGRAFDRLPAPIRALHRPGDRAIWAGRASITRGNSWIAGLVARLFGFPAAGDDVPVTVTFTTAPSGRETWERRFGAGVMTSTQERGRGRDEHLLVERFGPFAFGLALVAEEGRLRLLPRRWRAFGIPMPAALIPSGETFETTQDGRFRFHVEIVLPLFGLVVRYEGWLEGAEGGEEGAHSPLSDQRPA